MTRPPPRSTLFPYTTLFRSKLSSTAPASSARRSCATSTGWHNRPPPAPVPWTFGRRSEEHTSELQSLRHLVCRLLLEKKKKKNNICIFYHIILTHSTLTIVS